jgi:hypothetical protein
MMQTVLVFFLFHLFIIKIEYLDSNTSNFFTESNKTESRGLSPRLAETNLEEDHLIFHKKTQSNKLSPRRILDDEKKKPFRSPELSSVSKFHDKSKILPIFSKYLSPKPPNTSTKTSSRLLSMEVANLCVPTFSTIPTLKNPQRVRQTYQSLGYSRKWTVFKKSDGENVPMTEIFCQVMIRGKKEKGTEEPKGPQEKLAGHKSPRFFSSRRRDHRKTDPLAERQRNTRYFIHIFVLSFFHKIKISFMGL